MGETSGFMIGVKWFTGPFRGGTAVTRYDNGYDTLKTLVNHASLASKDPEVKKRASALMALTDSSNTQKANEAEALVRQIGGQYYTGDKSGHYAWTEDFLKERISASGKILSSDASTLIKSAVAETEKDKINFPLVKQYLEEAQKNQYDIIGNKKAILDTFGNKKGEEVYDYLHPKIAEAKKKAELEEKYSTMKKTFKDVHEGIYKDMQPNTSVTDDDAQKLINVAKTHPKGQEMLKKDQEDIRKFVDEALGAPEKGDKKLIETRDTVAKRMYEVANREEIAAEKAEKTKKEEVANKQAVIKDKESKWAIDAAKDILKKPDLEQEDKYSQVVNRLKDAVVPGKNGQLLLDDRDELVKEAVFGPVDGKEIYELGQRTKQARAASAAKNVQQGAQGQVAGAAPLQGNAQAGQPALKNLAANSKEGQEFIKTVKEIYNGTDEKPGNPALALAILRNPKNGASGWLDDLPTMKRAFGKDMGQNFWAAAQVAPQQGEMGAGGPGAANGANPAADQQLAELNALNKQMEQAVQMQFQNLVNTTKSFNSMMGNLHGGNNRGFLGALNNPVLGAWNPLGFNQNRNGALANPAAFNFDPRVAPKRWGPRKRIGNIPGQPQQKWAPPKFMPPADKMPQADEEPGPAFMQPAT